MPDGKSTGVYIKFVLVADKPFIRHVCGLLSHNANAFGAPFCTCCDGGNAPADVKEGGLCTSCDPDDDVPMPASMCTRASARVMEAPG